MRGMEEEIFELKRRIGREEERTSEARGEAKMLHKEVQRLKEENQQLLKLLELESKPVPKPSNEKPVLEPINEKEPVSKKITGNGSQLAEQLNSFSQRITKLAITYKVMVI